MYMYMYTCVWNSLVQLLRAWAPNPRVGGLNPCLGLAVVTLCKSLYPHCFSQPICKTGTWPFAGVDMTIDHGIWPWPVWSSPGFDYSLPMVNAPAATGPAVVGLFLC